jgi:hypothetical protein
MALIVESVEMTSKWGFVSKQLAEVRANEPVAAVTVELLRTLESETEAWELTDAEQQTVLDYVQKLSQGHSLGAEEADENWGPVVPGEYNIGDTVRVKSDAYTGDHGLRHNGKRGRIIAVHQSKTVVLYDDAPNSEESFFHEPYNLERLT